MGLVIGRRLVALVPTLLIVTFVVFLLGQLIPGDAASHLAGETARPERVQEIRQQLHLDDPLLVQYGRWLGDAVQLDFGESLFSSRSVADDIRTRLPVTLGLVAIGLVVGLVVGVPLGIVAGWRSGRLVDSVARLYAGVSWALPTFWLGTLLVVAFAVDRRWFPPSGYVRLGESPGEWLEHMVLPGVALGIPTAAVIVRQLRASLIDVLDEHYVRAAWARGARRRQVLFRHALKSAALPVVTTIGIQIGYILGGAVVVESLFSIPGLGNYMIDGISSSDLTVIQGVTIAFVIMQVLVNLAVDLSYGYLNPKIRMT